MLLQTTTPTILPVDSLHQITQTIIQQAKEDPNTFLNSMLQDGIAFGLKVLAAIVIYIVGAWIIKRVKRLLQRIFTRRQTERTLATFVSSLVTIMLTVLLIIITVGTLGVDTTSLAALLAAGGMAIGMALSGTVQNFAGGIMLLVFKPFKAGDVITAQGFTGTVTDVSIVSTKILTADHHEVFIPNGALANGNIDNFSSSDIRRIDLDISVAYGADADRCIETLTSLAKADSRILNEKTKGAAAPAAMLVSLNANDITFKLRVWVKADDFWGVTFDLNRILYTELPKRGFEFAYPHMDVNIVKS